MTEIASRTSDPKLAGSYCTFANAAGVLCVEYARYAVTYDPGDGQQAADPDGVCGRHLSEAVRQAWTRHKRAAVVQEVPGAWRVSDNRPRRRRA